MSKALSLFVSVFILSELSGSFAVAEDSSRHMPLPEHALLKRFVGSWQYTQKTKLEGGEVLGQGTLQSKQVGPFFIMSEWQGKVGDVAYKALQTLGYNPSIKKYEGAWVDSMMNHRWRATGDFDEATQRFRMTAEGPGPGGKTMLYRETYTLKSQDEMQVVSEMKQDGQWQLFMATKITRQ